MRDQLGIKALRPGSSGSEKAPNAANYDEAKANPFPHLPDALTLNNGEKVTTAKVWSEKRRPEIVEGFERYVDKEMPICHANIDNFNYFLIWLREKIIERLLTGN